MKKFVFLLMFILSAKAFGFAWPFPIGGSTPQHITSTFGEYRPASYGSYIPYHEEPHFHDGVDMVPNTGSVIGAEVWAVEDEHCWENGYYHGGYHIVRSDYHDYIHIDPNTALLDGDTIQTGLYWTKIGEIQNMVYPHLHVNNRAETSSPNTSNNVLDTTYGTGDRFDPLYEDWIPPQIKEVIFTEDEQHQIVYQHDGIPPNTDIDIIVKAEEINTYPYGTDDQNGVYKLGFSIDDPDNYDYRIQFNEAPVEWELFRVYDSTRQIPAGTNIFYYVVTNYMASNGYWSSGPAGYYYDIYIRLVDEQGKYNPYYSIRVNVTTEIREENLHKPDFCNRLSSIYPNPGYARINLHYQIAHSCMCKIIIYDCTGRIIKEFYKKNIPGSYRYTWDCLDKRGKAIASGCYFVKFEAGEFKTQEKILLVK